MDRQEYDLVVTEGLPNHDPVITSTPITQATADMEYRLQVTAEDSDGDPLFY